MVKAVRVVSPRTRAESVANALGVALEAMGWIVATGTVLLSVSAAVTLACALGAIYGGRKLRERN